MDDHHPKGILISGWPIGRPWILVNRPLTYPPITVAKPHGDFVPFWHWHCQEGWGRNRAPQGAGCCARAGEG